MKKMITMLLLMLCVAMAIQPAFAEYVTLAELRSQCQVTVELLLPNEDGTPTATTIPIIIPDTEGLHLQLMRPMVLDKTALLDQYTYVEEIPLGPDGHHEFFCFYRFAPKGKTRIFTYIKAGANLYRDHQPDNNDMPWNRPAEKLQEIIKMCGWNADVRVVWQAATSKGYAADVKLGHSTRGEAYAITVFNERYPVKGCEKGYYQLLLAQYLDDVRIFGAGPNGGYTFANTEREPEDGAMSFGSTLRMDVLSEEDFGIYVELMETEQVIRENTLLASFDVVLETIENRIGAGMLKTVYCLELGYAPLSVLNLDETNMQDAGKRYSILIPAWCVYGFDRKDDPFRAQNEYAVPTEQEYWESGNRYQLWINAITGEIMWNSLDEVASITNGESILDMR